MTRYSPNPNNEQVTLAEYGEEIKAQLREEYRVTEATKVFWQEFYDRHPNLRAHREIVQITYQENLDDLMTMTAGDALELLAERADERVNYLDRTRDQRAEAACFIGGPGLEGKPTGEQEFALPGPNVSMSSMLKSRKAARRDAHTLGFRSDSPTDKPLYGRRRA